MFYLNNQYPKRSQDLNGNEEDFSVDVITYTSDGVLNIGYWNYDTERWAFHCDTLVDPYEFDTVYDFVWMYPPVELLIAYPDNLVK